MTLLAVLVMLTGAAVLYWQLGVRDWANTKAEWIARSELLQASGFATEPLASGQSYFSQHPLLLAQLRFRPDPAGRLGTVIYDDPKTQRVLGSLEVPEELSEIIGSLPKLALTDFSAVARAYKLPGPETEAIEELARHLSQEDATFHALIEAARLPAGHFGTIWAGDIRKVLTPHYEVWTRVAKVSAIRSRIALARGRSSEAYEELTVVFRLAETVDADDVTLGAMVQTTLRLIALNVVWEGLETQSWSQEELIALDRELQGWRFIEEWIRAFQGERSLSLQAPSRELSDEEWDNLELLTGKMPRWVFRIPGLDEFADANYFRASTEFCYLPLLTRDWPKVRDGKKLAPRIPHYNVHAIYTKRLLPMDLLLTERGVIMESYHSQARTALALERYRFTEGSYPETLSALVPKYLSAVPVDVFDGAPLRYARTEDGLFRLYGTGWNLRDDGGEKALPLSYEEGDLMWR